MALDEISEKRQQIIKELCTRCDYTHALHASPAAVCRVSRYVKDTQVLDSCTLVFRDIDREAVQRHLESEKIRPSRRSNILKLEPVSAIKE